jgi:uncharacterized RDD family membrane protein YckC
MSCRNCGAANNNNDNRCSKCGKPLGSGEQDRWAPSQAALNSTDIAVDAGFAYSGFWRRVGASVIDWMLLSAISFVVNIVAALLAGQLAGGDISTTAAVISMVISLGFWLLVPWLYFSLFESSAQQATLGKLAVGVKVTDQSGMRIGFARATGRYWGKFISQVILYIGYIMAAFTARKQALHDMMAGTLVVYRNPSPATLTTAAAARPMPAWVIGLIILGCMVPVLGILAAIAIPAYKTYTVRAQVVEGVQLASDLKAKVAEKLAGSDRPIAEDLATLKVAPVSDNFVSSLTLESGAIIIRFGNQADRQLLGQSLALTPTRDGEGRIGWICGLHPPQEGLELGHPDPGRLTTVQMKQLPMDCRP